VPAGLNYNMPLRLCTFIHLQFRYVALADTRSLNNIYVHLVDSGEYLSVCPYTFSYFPALLISISKTDIRGTQEKGRMRDGHDGVEIENIFSRVFSYISNCRATWTRVRI